MIIILEMEVKLCQGCETEKSLDEFPVRNDRSGRLRPYCHSCRNDIERARYKSHKHSNYFRWKCTRIKSSSQSKNVPFDLTPEYLEDIWTGYCPVLKIQLEKYTNRSNPNAAELDRIIPEKGYIQGNVAFLSRRINKIKSNASYGEIIALGDWLGNYTY